MLSFGHQRQGFKWELHGAELIERRSVPGVVPVPEEINLIAKETNPGCGAGRENVVTVSSLSAAHRLRTICKHTAKDEKKKKKNQKDTN